MFMGLNTITGNLFFAPNFYETDPLLFQFLFIPQAWTIGVELTFYLMVPFLARKKIIYIIPLIIASLLIRYFLAKIGMKIDPWSYRFFPSELVFFLLGIISYRIYKFVPKLNLKPIYLIMILIYITTFSIFYKFLRQKYEFQIYMFSVFVCIPFLFTLTKSWKFDNYIGELTYPMYISHILVNSILLQLKIPEIGGLGLNLTVFTILFSILLHEVVVKKFERLRQRRLLPAPVPITVN
jgi:peptidoglycan/LPS O-acetylase OafA/YrhL